MKKVLTTIFIVVGAVLAFLIIRAAIINIF